LWHILFVGGWFCLYDSSGLGFLYFLLLWHRAAQLMASSG